MRERWYRKFSLSYMLAAGVAGSNFLSYIMWVRRRYCQSSLIFSRVVLTLFLASRARAIRLFVVCARPDLCTGNGGAHMEKTLLISLWGFSVSCPHAYFPVSR